MSAPKAGNVRYADGSVRAVYGFDANFVLGPAWTKASAVAFSDKGGILGSSGKIDLLRPDGSVAGAYATAESQPLLGIDGDLNTAVAWLPASGALVWWNGSAFRTTQLAGMLPGVATSVQSDGTTVTFLVTASDGSVLRTTVALSTGDFGSINIVPGARGPAFAQGPFVVFRNDQGLAVEQANGNVRTLDFPAPDLQIERMSSDWLHIHSSATNRDWALHLSRFVCALWQLPVEAVSQEAGK
ncbi:MAG: hypothetical protein ACREHD_27135 [Pirellulales bacterium]